MGAAQRLVKRHGSLFGNMSEISVLVKYMVCSLSMLNNN